jgi:hypothetical protein
VPQDQAGPARGHDRNTPEKDRATVQLLVANLDSQAYPKEKGDVIAWTTATVSASGTGTEADRLSVFVIVWVSSVPQSCRHAERSRDSLG